MTRAVIDNDALIKAAAYRLLADSAELIGSPVGVLGAARFVVQSRLEHHPGIIDSTEALACWGDFLACAEELEPTTQELDLATELEVAAADAGLHLDSGESQLCAILASREYDLLVSGDKRAAAAANDLLSRVASLDAVRGRWFCLEQLISTLAQRIGVDEVRSRVCNEPDVDTSLRMCMSCGAEHHQANEGLSSYIRDVRASAPALLADDGVLECGSR